MRFHHLHFYVQDATFWYHWFMHKLAFKAGDAPDNEDGRNAPSTPYKVVRQGEIEIRLSDPCCNSDAARYLQRHPAGVVDVALATNCFDVALARATSQGAKLLQPVRGRLGQRQCQLQGWADLRHTLIEEEPLRKETLQEEFLQEESLQEAPVQKARLPRSTQPSFLQTIDHVVLNVAKGQMKAASDWYERIWGLSQGQRFEINTAHSGLCSQVLVHPNGSLQLPINEPSSANSQIQEFIDHNRGAGIQHVALRSLDAVSAIAHFRQQGLGLIRVPTTYYEDLRHRPHCPLPEMTAAGEQKLLLDWTPGGQQGVLLQTFTKPIFSEPTFFFEIIERGLYVENGQIKNAQGFGEGNFQALFEAMERDQIERGSLV